MKAEYIDLMVAKNPHMKLPLRCLAHEIPILAAIHGEGQIEIVGNPGLTMDPDMFDLDGEYVRLESKYGTDPTGASWVQNVYGRPFEGRIEAAVKKGVGLVGLKKSGGRRATAQSEESTDPLS